MKDYLAIGSRGSKLALAQATWVKTKLALLNPTLPVRIEIIKTSGDIRSEPLSVIGGKGVFTRELEEALLDGRIDIAVHSLKDLPTSLPPQLLIAAICEREDPRDALVLNKDVEMAGISIDGLPLHSVVGTSSQRRLAQLKHLRGDLVVKDLRGNVDTRLRKLDEGHYDALILAAAGLRRLGLESRVSVPIPSEQMLPAVGQGAIALETRLEDQVAIEWSRKLDHEPTHIACIAERAMLRVLGGGCQLPIAGHAVAFYKQLRIDGLVADSQGKQVIRDHVSGATADAEKLGAELGQRLLEQGARSLLA
ncbi:MAG TPA: hydroxymethylbilane synthase [Pyrinomonadaceae bacterium]|nr:hydroxymethylbilane synthase [Pyrinomonadaceae bacterium]